MTCVLSVGVLFALLSEHKVSASEYDVTMPGAIETTRIDADEPMYCPHCGYDIRVATAVACPECGGAVDEETMRRAQVPWQSRRDIGRIRAFVRTCWRVTFQTQRLSYAVAQPVDLKDALKFRRVLVALLFGVFVLGMLIITVLALTNEPTLGAVPWQGLVASWFGSAVGSWLFFELLTGVHTYWFHPTFLPPQQRLRSLALSHYAGAPLILAVAGFAIFVASLLAIWIFSDSQGPTTFVITLWCVGLLLFVLGFAATWRVCFVMSRLVVRRNGLGRWSLFLLQPVLWAIGAGFFLVVLPGILFYIWLMLTTM